ncbi:MAG: ATP-binding protein, partial [Terrimonas sp.]|nr:ATP-binding protein [Terrimonas sp.]
KLIARKFIRNSGFRFDKDTDSLPDGEEGGDLPQNERLYQLAEDSNNDDEELPDSYTADVDRIVSLLIGESIYPDRYAFVRELIQNSVDACNRMKEKHTHLTPKIFININTEGKYIEVVDEGDGMAKSTLKNHFAVIGKSISQEYNDNVGKVNLISKFGIGFISTFIVAEKVVINTKSEDDDQIIFEIENVFKGFKYIQPSTKDFRSTTGTTVRVYLKKGYETDSVYNNIWKYCRHVCNLEINKDSSQIKLNDRWGVETASYHYSDRNAFYEYKFGLSLNTATIIASNSGFLISNYPAPILPFRFPAHIVGEINFFPKSIDFDVSRTNIIPSSKSDSIRREISLAVRPLFRAALENNDGKIYPLVVSYLHYYLQYFDANLANMDNSYKDFYSKKELISLCSEHTFLDYGDKQQKLGQIISVLKAKSIDRIYLLPSSAPTDYQKVVIEYLESKENLLIKNRNINVNFQDSQPQVVNIAAVVQLVAAELSITMQDIKSIHPSILTDMKLDKTQFDSKFQSILNKIENDYFVTIEIGKFSKLTKPSVSNGNQIFLNYNHGTFQSLVSNVNSINDDAFEIYLLGILNLQLRYNV